MPPAEAAKLLDLPVDASPEQLEARFLELRTKLEDKIAKAPTPGLKAKYRESLDAITTAFETLTLAADSSSLPVTTKQRTDDGGRSTASSPTPGPQTQNPRPAARKSGGKEFALVAVIAVTLLAVGGWFVMKTRAENAETVRLAAEQKAENERQVAAAQAEKDRLAIAARDQAEARRQADEAEKLRLEKAAAQVQGRLAQLRLAWEALEEDHRKAERRLSDLRGDERSLANAAKSGPTPELKKLRIQIGAQGEFVEWFGAKLSRHPAKLLRAQAEALLGARQVDDAAKIAAQASEEQTRVDQEVADARQAMLTITGRVRLELAPAGVQWTLADALGETYRGTGSTVLDGVAFGPVRVEVIETGYRPREVTGTLQRGSPLNLSHSFKPHAMTLTSEPSGAEVKTGSRVLGTTPLKFDWAGEGLLKLEFNLDGHEPTRRVVRIPEGLAGQPIITKLRPIARGLSRPDLEYSPRRFSVSMAFTSTSSGGDLKSPTVSTMASNSEELYEAVVDEESGRWKEVTVTTKSVYSSSGSSTPPGSQMPWRKHPGKGRWAFLKDGSLEGSFNQNGEYFAPPSAPVLALDAAACWPKEELTAVGQTWEIPVDQIAFWTFHRVPGSPSTATAKVTALRLSGENREADFEIVWQHASQEFEKSVKMTSKTNIRSVITATVDLRRQYISKLGMTYRFTNSNVIPGILGAASGSEMSMSQTFTVKPLD
jgi:hypothetical protein